MTQENKSAAAKAIKAVLDFIRKIFGGKNHSMDEDLMRQITENIANSQSQAKDAVSSFMLENQQSIVKAVETFSKENKEEIADLLKDNKISDINKLIKSSLMPNIEAILEDKELPIDVKSNPNRRLTQFLEDKVDNLKEELSGIEPEMVGMSEIVTSDAEKKLMEPQLSHAEDIGISKRTEFSREISQETVKEMMHEEETLELGVGS